MQQQRLEMKNCKTLDLGLADEPFTRSCTAQDYIRQKIPNDSEYDVTITSQNANSTHKEYIISNAFTTNQGVGRFSSTTKSAKKVRPGTQQNNRGNPAAVLDAYTNPHWLDLNASVTGNSTSNY